MNRKIVYGVVLDGKEYKLSDRTYEDLDEALDMRDMELKLHPDAVVAVVHFGDDIDNGYFVEKYITE